MPLDNLIMIRDRVLIKPKSISNKTDSGLYLPPNVKEKEKIKYGFVMKVGPGYPMLSQDEGEEWKNNKGVLYIPLQINVGDLAIFMLRDAFEVEYEKVKYFIVPQSSILMVEQDFE